MKKMIYGAWICLVLDVLLFIVSSMFIFATNSLWITLLVGALLYVLSWDAYKASSFLIKQYSNN